jgi:hypothetical protein
MKSTIPFIYASYHFMPSYGWHEQLVTKGLPPQIKLEPPLSAKMYSGIDTVATARNGYRNRLWFAPWHSSPLPDVFYEVIKAEQGSQLLCFYQPIDGHFCPFYLLLYRVDESFPAVTSSEFWATVRTHLDTLPLLLSDELQMSTQPGYWSTPSLTP